MTTGNNKPGQALAPTSAPHATPHNRSTISPADPTSTPAQRPGPGESRLATRLSSPSSSCHPLVKKKKKKMKKKRKKKMAAGRGRRSSISDLPDDVVQEILCRLPIKDATRTSVLSRRWLRLWFHRRHSIPHLDLSGLYNCSQIYQVLARLLHPSRPRPIRLFKVEVLDKRDDWRMRERRCVERFDRIFKIKELEEWNERWRMMLWVHERFNDVERWLRALSFHSSSSLRTLSLLLKVVSCDVELISRCFPSLTCLELSGRLYVPPQLRFQGGFASLRELHLHEFVPVNDCCTLSEASWRTKEGDSLSTLISACPLLETLRVSNLKRDCYPVFYLDINAPNLRRLNLEGLVLYDFTVTSAPLLEFASMNSLWYGVDESRGGATEVDCVLTNFFRGIVTIKKFELDHTVLKFFRRGGEVPERIPICFNNLRIISIQGVDLGCHKLMLVLLCLLRSCPSLLQLIMGERYYYICDREANHDVWDLKAREDVFLFNNLEVVTMTHIMCKRHELAFVKFVLAKAKVLKTVNISFHENLKHTDPIVAELMEFPRVSNQAQILLTR